MDIINFCMICGTIQSLDAALESGVEAGGWCPEGRMAQYGIIPEKYPVKELPKSGYRQRAKKNVIDSDGTVIIYFVPERKWSFPPISASNQNFGPRNTNVCLWLKF